MHSTSSKIGYKGQEITHMLNNTASLPPKPVDNRADATGIIVQEPLRIYICRAKNGDIDCGPNGTEQVEGRIGAVINQWIVVLE